jgi:hypothetical protein
MAHYRNNVILAYIIAFAGIVIMLEGWQIHTFVSVAGLFVVLAGFIFADKNNFPPKKFYGRIFVGFIIIGIIFVYVAYAYPNSPLITSNAFIWFCLSFLLIAFIGFGYSWLSSFWQGT